MGVRYSNSKLIERFDKIKRNKPCDVFIVEILNNYRLSEEMYKKLEYVLYRYEIQNDDNTIMWDNITVHLHYMYQRLKHPNKIQYLP